MRAAALERTGSSEEALELAGAAAHSAEEHGMWSLASAARVRLAALHQLAGRAVEAAEVLELALSVATTPAERAEVRRNQAASLRLRGQLGQAEATLDTALAEARTAGDKALEMRVLHGLGNLKVHSGRAAEALTWLTMALERARDIGDESRQALVLSSLATLAYSTGSLASCVDTGTEAGALYRRLGHRRGLVSTRSMLAEVDVVLRARDPQTAVALQEAIVGAEACGLDIQAASTRWAMGVHFHGVGAREAAREVYRAAEAAFSAIGLDMGVALTVACRALLEPETAVQDELLEHAETLFASSGWPHGGQVVATARDIAAGRLPTPDPAGPFEVRALRTLVADDVHPTWTTAADGSVVTSPDAARIDLGRRGAPRRVLQALIGSHRTAPGETATAETLIEAGWPGERIRPESATARLHTAIRTLRRLGLEPLLETRSGGYRLVPQARIVTSADH